ncbi:glycosyltransferase family 87 protein [Limnoglobus roseus]|uniref:DUF2029 domain-containing protein n=1 Tax=Limnoglobus roseus TaxID=2598579 RepID=A0A5C1A985_9BACT|nr:glycosyltransferase family 87 protein [Limnoglobus roseus]QEL15761.1 hypothetical protein PX52LOC_02696 [Limnoglobus roseus]
MTQDRIVQFFRERVIFAKLAAIILWISYAVSILMGDHHGGMKFTGPVVGSDPNSWIVYDEHYGVFNFRGETNGADHLAWYTAARLIREGEPEKIYDYGYIHNYQKEMVPKKRWDSLMAYRNPPFYCLLYLPTSYLSFTQSWLIWCGIYIFGVWFAVGWLGGGRTEFWWLMAFFPTFTAISYGQNSLLSFIILAGTYRLLKGDRVFLAGLIGGLLWFKPPMLTGLVLWGLLDIRRLWLAALGVVLTGVVLTLGTYPFIPAVWDGFIDSLNGNVKFTDFEQFKMHNPVAFWRLLLPEATAWHWPLAAACSLLAVLWFVWVWWKHRNDLAILFGALVFVTLWGSPHALIYEWSVLGITGILWWPRLAHVPSARFLLYGAAWLVMFVSTHLAEFILNLQGDHTVFPRYAVQISMPAMAVIAVWCGRLLRSDPVKRASLP